MAVEDENKKDSVAYANSTVAFRRRPTTLKLGRHHCFFPSQFSPIIPHVSVLSLNAMVHDCRGYQRQRRHIRRSFIGGCPLPALYIICGSCKGFAANALYNNYKTYSRSPPLPTLKPQENPRSKEFKPKMTLHPRLIFHVFALL